MGFSNFVTSSKIEELKELSKSISTESLDLRKDFEELDRLSVAQEKLIEPYEVGMLNKALLNGEKVDINKYPKPILAIESGDLTKLQKHTLYNKLKIEEVKGILNGILDIKSPSISTETYERSYNSYMITVEGIGDILSKIGEKIKKAYEYIVNKIKQFFNWITGKNNEADSSVKSAKEGKLDEKDAQKSGASEDNKKTKGNPQNNLKTVDAKEFYKKLDDVFKTIYSSIENMGEELTDNDLLTIAKPLEEINLGGNLIAEIKKKCLKTKETAVTDGSSVKQGTANYVSKASTLQYLNALEKNFKDKRTAFEKTVDMFSNAAKATKDTINKIGETVETGLNAAGRVINKLAGREVFKCKPSAKKSTPSGGKKSDSSGDGNNATENKAPVIDTTIAGDINDQGDKENFVLTCKNYLNTNTSAKTYLTINLIQGYNAVDIRNLGSTLDDFEEIVNTYFKGFGAALATSMKERRSQAQAQHAQENPVDPNKPNDKNEKAKVKFDKTNLDVKVTLPEDVLNRIGGLTSKIMDKGQSMDKFKELISSGSYVFTDGNRNILDYNNVVGDLGIVKGFGTALDKVIIIKPKSEGANLKTLTLNELEIKEVQVEIRESNKESVIGELYKLTLKDLKTLAENLARDVEAMKNADTSVESRFKSIDTKLRNLQKFYDGKANGGITISKESANELSKFMLGTVKYASLVACAVCSRKQNIASELEVIMNYTNYVNNVNQDYVYDQNKSEMEAMKDIMSSTNIGNGQAQQ